MAAMLNVAFPGLPNEILFAIFSYCNPNTLTVTALVSHNFRYIAESILYSSISLYDTLSESSPQPLRTLRWCDSMLRRSHLSDNTRKLQIRWHAANPGGLMAHSLIPACTEISKTIRLLTLLESLEIFLGPANLMAHVEPASLRMHTIEHVIRGVHLPYMRNCSLGADYTKGAQPYTSVLPVFLASSPLLRHLKLFDHYTALDLPPWAIPNVASFRGTAIAAATLLPGRPVQALALVGQDSDVTRQNLPRMTLTTLPLRNLDLSAMSVRPALLKNVSTHFPTVQSLRVRLALRHTLHYAFSGIRLLAGLSSVLSALQLLEVLDLSPTDVDGVGRPDPKEELVLVEEWGRASPSLYRVIFPSEAEWLRQGKRWHLISN
ncbi:hypothetical protein C0993_002623 [Termitomyces sp. T159_Od127]|nr:hypothetical protein C0993_002623 [Termitomyces sp. T159_Od127]